jgi:hypothetical protein
LIPKAFKPDNILTRDRYLVAAVNVLTIMDLVVFADYRPDELTCLITPSAPS